MSTPAGNRRAGPDSVLPVLAALLFFLALLLLLFGLNMRRELNHDEHQFIAGAALTARADLAPYRDFAYFHVPLQNILFAQLFRAFDSLLLTTRIFNIVWGWLSLVVVFSYAWYRRAATLRGEANEWSNWSFAALAALWTLALPLFSYSSGRAWNHDLPTFLLLTAVILQLRFAARRRAPGWFAITGLLMGLATATRLSFGVIAIPFVLFFWLLPNRPIRRRLIDTVMFGLGALTGGLPLVLTFLQAPEQFFFGNVTYVRLNTLFYRSLGTTEAMSLPAKFSYLGEQWALQPTAVITLLAALLGIWPLRRLFRRAAVTVDHESSDPRTDTRRRVGFLGLLLLFALLSGLAATPSQPQYYFPLFILVMVLIVDAYIAWPPHLRAGGIYAYVLGALATIAVAVPTYAPGTAVIFQPDEWFPAKVHSYGELIADLVEGGPGASGRVLTLAPLYPLEGGAAVYPAFATGPFAWRVAALLDPETRQQFEIVAPEDLDVWLESEPPRALLTGVEEDDADEEEVFVAYARKHKYVPVTLPDESVLWLSPQARWGDAIQLGGALVPRAPVQPGESILLFLYLQSLRTMETNYNVLMRLTDASGNEVARSEGWPFGSPTTSWPVGNVWVDGHELAIPATAEPGYYRVEAGFYDPATLDELGATVPIGHLYVGDPVEPVPVAAEELQARFGEDIALVHVESKVAPDGRTPNGAESVTVDLTWQALRAPQENYTVFVQVLDENGNLKAQHDTQPKNGFLPTRAWRPNTLIVDSIQVLLPTDLPAGDYAVIVGLYEPDTLARLPVRADAQDAGDYLTVATFQVK